MKRVFLGMAAAMAAISFADAGRAAGLFPYGNSTMVAAGEGIYADSCASCHGASLEGEADWRSRNSDGSFRAPPHDETGHTWHHPDQQLFEIVKFGTEAVTGGAVKSSMLGFADTLTDEEILSVMAFIKAQWPTRIIERHDALNLNFEASRK